MWKASSSSDELGQSSGTEKEDESAASIGQGGGMVDRDIEKRLDDARVGSSSQEDSPLSQHGADIEPIVDGDKTVEHAATTREKPTDGLSRVLSRVISRASTVDAGPPPDGGVKAWLTVACAHLVIMNTWGFINSFGVFQTYYVTALARPPSDISWIGSVQIFLLFFIGTLTGRATDAGYFRPLVLLGSAFQIVGIFTTAQATQYWQLFLSQGICMGLGNGCLFCPTMAVLSTYFDKRKMFAMGVAACGSGVGGLVYPSMVRQLLPSIGFAWTIRAIGFSQLTSLAVVISFLRTRIPPRRTGALVDWAAFKELEYTFYAAGTFLCFTGLYFPVYYVASYSTDIIGMTYSSSLNLLLVLNGSGIVGRLGPNHIADRVGPITVFVPVALSCAVILLSWTAVTTPAGLYVWSVFYGAASGGIQSLFPACLTSLTTDFKKVGVRMGMIFTITGFATLVGPPVAGAIITSMGGSYHGAQGFAGALMMLGMGFAAAARTVKMRRLGKGWMEKI